MFTELLTDKLRHVCDPDVFQFQTTADVPILTTIVGQDRAVQALQFGLGIKGLGFNIYVAGVPGTGKETAVKRFLEKMGKDRPAPDDWCYVNNFKEPSRPKVLRLPPGKSIALQSDVRELIENAKRDIRSVFESDEYVEKREETVNKLQSKQESLLTHLTERARQDGFAIKVTSVGTLAVALKDGKPLDDQEFMDLSKTEQEEITKKREVLKTEIQSTIRQAKELERNTDKVLHELDRQVAIFALNHLVEDLQEQYRDWPDVVAYLDAVKKDILEHLSSFRSETKEDAMPPFMPVDREAVFKRYEVNVLVDNGAATGTPVVVELNPTYNNLFGRIEKEAQFGAMVTDFTMIREGCLHRANGGYLVLPIEEVLRNLFAWDSLKRALKNREIVIEEAGERLGFITTKSLRPDPIPLDVKVVLIGQPDLYYLLQAYDSEFSELFKVKADFDTRMPRNQENVDHYAAFTAMLCQDESLKHLDRSALAKIVEHGSRLAGDQDKLSVKFSDLADVIREASFYAAQDSSSCVAARHVKKAINQHFYRSNLLQERIMEMINRGILLIDVTGRAVGQVNGLSVISLGDITFGRPSRITASTGVGREGLIDIERKAELGGPIHTKGVMILAGYLTQKYAQHTPLSLSSHLVFEQSYAGIEGDSASSAELYALLSSLANLPVRQGVAVTGSVNQKGHVQAIGGVNEKIEGFFEVCQARGLSGDQGVIIPNSNLTNLMLKEEVVSAVHEQMFHIWPITTVDEGIEILTEMRSGQRTENGAFEEGTISHLVDRRLKALAEATKEFTTEFTTK